MGSIFLTGLSEIFIELNRQFWQHTACPKWNKGPPWKFPGDLEISRGPWNFQGPWIFPGPGNFQVTLKFPGVCVFYTHGKFQGGSKGKCISQSTTPPLKNRAWFCYQKSAQTFIFDNRVTMLISFRPLSLSIRKFIRLIHHSSLDNALFIEVTFMNCSLITEIFIVPSFCVVIWFFFISLMPLHSLTIVYLFSTFLQVICLILASESL